MERNHSVLGANCSSNSVQLNDLIVIGEQREEERFT